jgi:hypothetical protein
LNKAELVARVARDSGLTTVAFLLPYALLVGHVWAEPSYTIMGNVQSYEEDGHTITFTCQNGKVRLSFLEEDLVRVHMAPDGEFPPDDLHLGENGPYAVVTYDWPGVSYEISESFVQDSSRSKS